MAAGAVSVFTHLPVVQGSLEWRQARCGKITGSRADAIAKRLKNGTVSADWHTYQRELVVERLTGKVEEGVTSRDMDRGIELEPYARSAYEGKTGYLVEQVGLFVSTTLPDVACSVDGYIHGANRIVEIKCPRAGKVLAMLEDGGIPEDYRWQIAHNLHVTQASACDLVVFCPDLPEHLRLTVLSCLPTDVDDYLIRLMDFRAELQRKEEYWRTYGE